MTEERQPSGERELSSVLSEFARTMVTDFPIEAILDRLVERIVDILAISAAGVTLIEPDTVPRYVAASNKSALRYEKLQTELGEGPCLLAYNSGETVEVPDLRTETRFPEFTPRALAAGMMAVFTFPLYHGDSRLGALDLYRDTPGALTREAITIAQTLADVVAAYVLNAKARENLQDSSDRSRQASLHDALTGLPNRVLLLERMEHAFLRNRRTNRAAAVFFIDLDLFKAVNDTHGHGIGDELLIAVARRLAGLLRPADTLGPPCRRRVRCGLRRPRLRKPGGGHRRPDDRGVGAALHPVRGGGHHQCEHRDRLFRPRRPERRGAPARRGHGHVPGEAQRRCPPTTVRPS